MRSTAYQYHGKKGVAASVHAWNVAAVCTLLTLAVPATVGSIASWRTPCRASNQKLCASLPLRCLSPWIQPGPLHRRQWPLIQTDSKAFWILDAAEWRAVQYRAESALTPGAQTCPVVLLTAVTQRFSAHTAIATYFSCRASSSLGRRLPPSCPSGQLPTRSRRLARSLRSSRVLSCETPCPPPPPTMTLRKLPFVHTSSAPQSPHSDQCCRHHHCPYIISRYENFASHTAIRSCHPTLSPIRANRTDVPPSSTSCHKSTKTNPLHPRPDTVIVSRPSPLVLIRYHIIHSVWTRVHCLPPVEGCPYSAAV